LENSIIASIFGTISSYGNEEAVKFKRTNGKQWLSYTWNELSDLMKQTSKALIAAGVRSQENVAIFSQNKVEWSIADLGIMGTGAVSVPIYATNTADQARYIVDEAEIKVIFVGDQEQYDKALEIYADSSGTLQQIIVMEDYVSLNNEAAIYFNDFLKKGDAVSDEQLSVCIQKIKGSDLATIIYTSGTTGEPKGVMLTHDNFNEAFRIHDLQLNVSREDHSLAFLPLSHVFERCWSLYVLSKGITNCYLSDPKDVLTALGEIKPTMMCSVPRLYQKAYHMIKAKVEAGSNLKKELFHAALETGKRRSEMMRDGKRVPLSLRLRYSFFDALIFKKIKAVFGGNLKMIPCGGGPLSGEITEFFHAIGMPVLIGYGLTETTATVSVFPEEGYQFGTAGKAMPEIELKIGADDEILVRGKTVMRGYYKKPEETAKTFENGWLKTGDAGKIDEHGHVTITDRIKDLMKTSGGKYVAPQPIESILTNDNFIENAILVGDDKPFVSALLVPNFEALREYAHSLNLKYHSLEDLIKKSHIREFYEQKLEQLQQSLANFEKVKEFRLLHSDFSMATGELTPTLKIRRQIIIDHFSPLIDEMYAY
jgi:long-chain acyl-CoA synthetase